MSVLQFTVFATAGTVFEGDPIQEGQLTVGASSAKTAVITGDNKERRRVRLAPTGDMYVHWGDDSNNDLTAANDGTRGRLMFTNTSEAFDIEAGYKIAAIDAP